MSGFTTWTRLEPVPRLDSLKPGLRAALGDPLWLLARQWQFGEFAGEDAGSPVESVVEVELAPLERYRAGSVTQDIAGSDLPLEARVEALPLAGRVLDLRHRIDAGQHFLRLLRLAGAEAAADAYRKQFPLPDMVQTDAPLVMAGIARRVPDGRALADTLLRARGAATSLTLLPPLPAVDRALEKFVINAGNRFLSWWQSRHLGEEIGAGTAWQPSRLEHDFAVSARLSDGPVVLRAAGYDGERLDWSDFDLSGGDLGMPAAGATPSRRLTRRTLPSRAYFAGMPSERFWEFEDSVIRFGVESLGRGDIAHMILSEFALTYGNDWFTVPLRLLVGSVVALRSLRIKDSFGVESDLACAQTVGAGDWRMFSFAAAHAAQPALFFLPPVLGDGLQSEPVEDVALFRDEMANMVWAVERRLERPEGGWERGSDHYRTIDAALRQSLPPQSLPQGSAEADLIYRLNSPVPEHWFPMVPIRPSGAAPGVVELQLRPLTRWDASGTARVTQPSAELLRAAAPLPESEVPRDGVVAATHWQMTRSVSGHYHLWLSRRVRVGGGEGSSGLVHDIARRLR